jgi:hypothetical protein
MNYYYCDQRKRNVCVYMYLGREWIGDPIGSGSEAFDEAPQVQRLADTSS